MERASRNQKIRIYWKFYGKKYLKPFWNNLAQLPSLLGTVKNPTNASK
jgi:hypothetical protein